MGVSSQGRGGKEGTRGRNTAAGAGSVPVSTTQGFRNLTQSNRWEFLIQRLEDSPEKAFAFVTTVVTSRRNCGEQTVNILSKFPQCQLSPVDFSPRDVPRSIQDSEQQQTRKSRVLTLTGQEAHRL